MTKSKKNTESKRLRKEIEWADRMRSMEKHFDWDNKEYLEQKIETTVIPIGYETSISLAELDTTKIWEKHHIHDVTSAIVTGVEINCEYTEVNNWRDLLCLIIETHKKLGVGTSEIIRECRKQNISESTVSTNKYKFWYDMDYGRVGDTDIYMRPGLFTGGNTLEAIQNIVNSLGVLPLNTVKITLKNSKNEVRQVKPE